MNLRLERIAIIAGRDPSVQDDTDGGSVFLEYLVKTLSARGIAVDVYLPLGVAGGRYDPKRAVDQQLRKGAPSLVRYIYVPVEPPAHATPFQNGESYFVARIERSERFAQALGAYTFSSYDAVYVLHLANAFFLVKHQLLPLHKTVIFPMMTSSNYEEFTQVPSSYIELEAQTLRAARHISSPSDDEIGRIVARFAIPRSSFFKIHRGFEPEDFPAITRTSGPRADTLTLICANGIRPQKDHLFLVSVAEELLSLGLSVQIHLTGNNGRSHNPIYNAYTERFWREVRSRLPEGVFIAHDIISRSKLVQLMQQCDLAVYASRSETFGKSALESVVSGLPTLVCSDVPAFREFIAHGKTGYVAPRDAPLFAKDVVALAHDNETYCAISRNGIRLRASFTWERVILELLEAQQKRGITQASGIQSGT